MGGIGQAVAPLDLAAVAFVTDDGAFGAEEVAALQGGSSEDPVVGTMHGEGAGAVHELAVAAVIAAVQEADAGVYDDPGGCNAGQRGGRDVAQLDLRRMALVPVSHALIGMRRPQHCRFVERPPRQHDAQR